MRGDHLYFHTIVAGIPFEHHGIDMGDGTVIHLAPVDGARITLRDSTARFSVRRDTMEAFCQGRSIRHYRHTDCLPPEQITANAEKLLGSTGYHLLDGNCEHFAHQCCTGRNESRQVEMSQSVLISMTSLATKAVWSVTSRNAPRTVAHLTTKVATKSNPLLLIADGVELAALSIGCASGLSANTNRRTARFTGTLAAAGIGAAVGGPAGAIASVALHNGSTALAEQICSRVRRLLS